MPQPSVDSDQAEIITPVTKRRFEIVEELPTVTPPKVSGTRPKLNFKNFQAGCLAKKPMENLPPESKLEIISAGVGTLPLQAEEIKMKRIKSAEYKNLADFARSRFKPKEVYRGKVAGTQRVGGQTDLPPFTQSVLNPRKLKSRRQTMLPFNGQS